MRADGIVRDERGAALVEAALVLPVLLVLLFGITDLSLYLWRVNLAEKAVQLGLRKAVVSDPVADGPGLSRFSGASYWDGLPLGATCRSDPSGTSRCPAFSVECGPGGGCTCRGTGCGRFTWVGAKMAPIVEAMRSVLPELRAEQVRITYTTNDLGYVGRPLPVPVDVMIRIADMSYEFGLLGSLFGRSLPIAASATMPSESLTTER